jgi:hypothetical protein
MPGSPVHADTVPDSLGLRIRDRKKFLKILRIEKKKELNHVKVT